MIVGGIYILLSMPFILGYLTPSIHEGGYEAFYVFLNLPGLLVVSGLSETIWKSLFSYDNSYASNMITLTLILGFWVAISFIIGWALDVRNKKKSAKA